MKTTLLSFAILGFLAGVARATPLVTVSGFLNDETNPSLVGSGPDPDPPLFGDDFEIANNVAVYPLALADPGSITFDSNGFAAGGIDPYFTLFAGGSPATATFVGSNFAQAFSTGGDFLLAFDLPAGNYFFAIGAFANMSFAENLGAGTLAEGFIALGQPDLLGTYYYELAVSTSAVPTTPVPEPSSLVLAAGLIALACGLRPGRRRTGGAWPRAFLGPLVLSTVAAPAAAQAQVTVQLADGQVSVHARQASTAAILAEWARVGGVAIVNPEALPEGPPRAFDISVASELQMLDALLQGSVGFALALRAPGAPRTGSSYQRLVLGAPRELLPPEELVMVAVVSANLEPARERLWSVPMPAPPSNGGDAASTDPPRMLLRISESGEPISAPAPPPPEARPASDRRVGLGVRPDPVYAGPGVRVATVIAGSSAEKAGLAPGDVIVSVDGHEVAHPQAFAGIVARLVPGQVLPVVVGRGGHTFTLSVVAALD